jgi:hypothetical protein
VTTRIGAAIKIESEEAKAKRLAREATEKKMKDEDEKYEQEKKERKEKQAREAEEKRIADEAKAKEDVVSNSAYKLVMYADDRLPKRPRRRLPKRSERLTKPLITRLLARSRPMKRLPARPQRMRATRLKPVLSLRTSRLWPPPPLPLPLLPLHLPTPLVYLPSRLPLSDEPRPPLWNSRRLLPSQQTLSPLPCLPPSPSLICPPSITTLLSSLLLPISTRMLSLESSGTTETSSCSSWPFVRRSPIVCHLLRKSV